MEQLNTLIKINEIKHQKNNLKFKSSGYLDIKYFGNETNKNNEINLTVEIIKEIESLNINLNLNFTYVSECSRCLSRSNKQDTGTFNNNFSTISENDYDIDINTENIDVLSIVSEVIISKMDLTNICKKDCKGLCYLCGKNQNKHICSHEEKNIKESPFSSLSELDL